MQKIIPVILSGGDGTRLWPISRKNMPKQFIQDIGRLAPESLFQLALKRASSTVFADPIVIASKDHRFIVEKQILECGLQASLLLEPEGKNTAPAAFAASSWILECANLDDDSLVLLLPADHYIPDRELFERAVLEGVAAAATGAVVLFGIKPYSLSASYGYIEVEKKDKVVKKVSQFIEKPELEELRKQLVEDGCLWNSGICLFRADTMIELAQKYQPKMLSLVKKSLVGFENMDVVHQLRTEIWTEIVSESVDYAILEKADQILCIEFRGDWLDLGGWRAMGSFLTADAAGNSVNGQVEIFDSKKSTFWSQDKNQLIVALGLDSLSVVATQDAILIAPSDRVDEIKGIVSCLDGQGYKQAFENRFDYRPWGWFEVIFKGRNYQVKRLHVYPGEELSLQSHKFRAENWVVVEGIATVTLAAQTKEIRVNESVFIKAGEKHSLMNKTESELVVVEVQVGEYLGEDDIVRYSDKYRRTV